MSNENESATAPTITPKQEIGNNEITSDNNTNREESSSSTPSPIVDIETNSVMMASSEETEERVSREEQQEQEEIVLPDGDDEKTTDENDENDDDLSSSSTSTSSITPSPSTTTITTPSTTASVQLHDQIPIDLYQTIIRDQQHQQQQNQSPSSSLSLPPNVEKALKQIGSSSSSSLSSSKNQQQTQQQQNDIFDSSSFDAIDYLNQILPNEQSLVEHLDDFSLRLKRNIRMMDSQILSTIRQQSQYGVMSRHELDQSKLTIQTLFIKVKEIRSKAENSENTVRQITNEIRTLDHGKKNLIASITTLQRLHMLTSTVDQLQLMIQKRQYGKAADKLIVANQLIQYFAPFKQIEKIESLMKQVEVIRAKIQDQISMDVKQLVNQDTRNTSLETSLVDACTVIDALGERSRNQLITQFVKSQIDHYRLLFCGSRSNRSKLDDIKKRYEWLKKRIDVDYEKNYAHIFPNNWCVRQELVVEFCLTTREDIVNILNTTKETIDPTVLYRAIVSTIKFERIWHERYHVTTDVERQVEIRRQKQKLQREAEELSRALTEQSSKIDIIEIHKKKFKNEQKQKDLERVIEEQQEKAQKERLKNVPSDRNYNFIGFISTAFDEHMDVYIKYEDKSLADAIRGFCKKESWTYSNETNSSQELFMFIADSIQNCKSVSKGKVLMRLHERVWRKHLRQYANTMMQNLPKITPNAKDIPPPPREVSVLSSLKDLVGQSDYPAPNPSIKVRFTEEEEKSVCFIIKLAVYCQENIEVLAQQLRTTLDEPFCNQINMEEETNKFYAVIKTAVEQLVLNLMYYVDREFSEIQRLPLGTQNEVIDQSTYVTNIMQHLSDALQYLVDYIPRVNFKFLCDFLIIQMLNSFILHIYKAKRVNDQGAQQLLLDITSLVNFLKTILNLGDPERYDEDEMSAFGRKVQLLANKPESILKVLLSPLDTLVESYRSLVPDSNLNELNNLLELKGVAPNDRAMYISEFNQLDGKKTSFSSMIKNKMDIGVVKNVRGVFMKGPE